MVCCEKLHKLSGQFADDERIWFPVCWMLKMVCWWWGVLRCHCTLTDGFVTNVMHWNVWKIDSLWLANGLAMMQKVFKWQFTVWVWMFMSMGSVCEYSSVMMLYGCSLLWCLLCLLGIYCVLCEEVYAIMWSFLQQFPMLDGFTYWGEYAAFLCIFHSPCSLLGLTDWLWRGNADFLSLWPTLQAVSWARWIGWLGNSSKHNRSAACLPAGSWDTF